LPIERPIFAMNDLTGSLYEDLGLVSCRAIASLAWYDGSHLGGSINGTAWTPSVLRRSTEGIKMDENGQKTRYNGKLRNIAK
jgi:hypothetical protein